MEVACLVSMATKFDRNKAIVKLDGALDDSVLPAYVCLADAVAGVVSKSAMTPRQVTHAHNCERVL
jgi:hypothetical protein